MQSSYSDEQVDHYLDFISIPDQFLRKNHPKPGVEFLKALHTHQLCTIPFDNLDIHYNRKHAIELDPQNLYRKLVSPKGKGGYCMENGIFFNHILRALGFRAYLAGGRVRPRTNGVPSGPYMGWVHCVNIVTFENGSRWMTDVGYGGDGPISPLPLVEGVVSPNIGTQEVRLVHASIEGQVDLNQKQWIYQFRNSPDKEFNACYAFLDREFIHQDFEVMNYYTSTNVASYMTSTAVVVKFLHTEYKIYGKLMLINNEVKENTGGKTSTVLTMRDEVERVKVLKDRFSLILDGEDCASIHETRLALSRS